MPKFICISFDLNRSNLGRIQIPESNVGVFLDVNQNELLVKMPDVEDSYKWLDYERSIGNKCDARSADFIFPEQPTYA